MTDKFVMHGVNLTDMGIGDSVPVINTHEAEIAMAEHFVRQILGSITFGPVVMYDPEDIEDCDDRDYERPFSD